MAQACAGCQAGCLIRHFLGKGHANPGRPFGGGIPFRMGYRDSRQKIKKGNSSLTIDVMFGKWRSGYLISGNVPNLYERLVSSRSCNAANRSTASRGRLGRILCNPRSCAHRRSKLCFAAFVVWEAVVLPKIEWECGTLRLSASRIQVSQ